LIKSLFILVNVYSQAMPGKVLNFGFTFKQIILGSFLEKQGIVKSKIENAKF